MMSHSLSFVQDRFTEATRHRPGPSSDRGGLGPTRGQRLSTGLLGLAGIGAIAILFAKVVRDRSANTEDDYYSKNVEK